MVLGFGCRLDVYVGFGIIPTIHVYNTSLQVRSRRSVRDGETTDTGEGDTDYTIQFGSHLQTTDVCVDGKSTTPSELFSTKKLQGNFTFMVRNQHRHDVEIRITSFTSDCRWFDEVGWCVVVWIFGCLVVWLFGCLVVWLVNSILVLFVFPFRLESDGVSLNTL